MLSFFLLGFYCNATNGPVINYAVHDCPPGHYCPNGTKFDIEYPCPLGTYRNTTNGVREEDCTDCAARYACDQKGLANPSVLCSAGYFCRSGSNTTTPLLGDNANECPAGHYCPEGISSILLNCYSSISFSLTL